MKKLYAFAAMSIVALSMSCQEINDDIDEGSFPEHVYVVGTVNDFTSWVPNQGVLMENQGKGIYVVSDIYIKDSFALCTQLGETATDYATYTANRLGPAAGEDDEIQAKIGDNLVNGSGPNAIWYITPGYYDLTYNAAEKVLNIENNSHTKIPEVLYLVGYTQGGNGNWDDTGVSLEKTDDEGIFRGEVTLIDYDGTKSSYFSLRSEDNIPYGPTENGEIITEGSVSDFASNNNYWEVEMGVWPANITIIVDFNNMQITVDELMGVASVAAESQAAPEYYNLQGVRVNVPDSGIYIMRSAGTTSKVVIK